MPKGGARRGKGKGAKWIFDHVGYQGDDCLKWPFTTTLCRRMSNTTEDGHLNVAEEGEEVTCKLCLKRLQIRTRMRAV